MAKSTNNNTKHSSKESTFEEKARVRAKKMVEGLNRQVLKESALEKTASEHAQIRSEALNKKLKEEDNERSSKGFDRLKEIMRAIDLTKGKNDNLRDLKTILETERDQILNGDSSGNEK